MLHFYILEICEGDGLPSKICFPCLWRMLEFHAYKKNVSHAELEMKKLLNTSRSNSDEVSTQHTNDNDELEEEETPMNHEVEAPGVIVNEREVSMKQEIDTVEWRMREEIYTEKDILEVSVKDEIDIVEWEMPRELQSKVDIEEVHCLGRHLTVEKDINSIDNAMEASEVLAHGLISLGSEIEMTEEEFIHRNDELNDLQFSDLNEASTSECMRVRDESSENAGNGSSVVSDSENKDENEGAPRRVGLNDRNEEEELLDALILESSDNISESGASRSVTPIESKKAFFCDICKKSFRGKKDLGRHVRTYYNDRPFKCIKCCK